jgi:hypothetical protein
MQDKRGDCRFPRSSAPHVPGLADAIGSDPRGSIRSRADSLLHDGIYSVFSPGP